MTLSRRDFLRSTAAASAALLIPASFEAMRAGLAAAAPMKALGYGPLVPDPAGLLDLPAGFQYRLLSTALEGTATDARFSQRLTNGDPVPAKHDGMAAFPGPDGITILVRNHELDPGQSPAVDPAGARRYDPRALGGTTTLWVDAERNLVRSFASLSGTWRNCAGGPTPWGSWLTCEECVYMPGGWHAEYPDRIAEADRRHGYVFEVDARAESLVDPVPIRGMGRFYHEAVAVDPATGFVYLTEDRDDGLLYRYRPDVVTRREPKTPAQMALGDLALGGTLEALRIHGMPGAPTQNWGPKRTIKPGRTVGIDWVLIPDPDPDRDLDRDPEETLRPGRRARGQAAETSTRRQGLRFGCAQFARNEGITFHRGQLFICSTSGGVSKKGQVWKLDPRGNDLTLMIESDDASALDMPDNITPAPNGDLVTCEDNGRENFVSGITPKGRVHHIARNAHNRSEFAGACFSPDGRTLFVNVQNPGLTFAVWGPWETRRD
jgi:secreted PhoX family phosphatase